MRLLIVSHYFPPEVGAPQTRLFELARRMVRRGHRVTVLAPLPSYPTGVVPPGYRGRLLLFERMEGVRVVRTWAYATPNRGFVRRILNHLSFTLAALVAAPLTGPADVVFVESPPLFHGFAGAVIARLKGAAFVFNVSDLWPASAVEMGMLRQLWLIRAAEWLERWTYARAAMVTVVTRGIVDRLRATGLPAEKVQLLTNGVDADVFRPVPERDALRRELGVDGAFVALYAGTHGLAHGLETVLEAADRLRARSDVRFVFAGEGAEKERLVARAGELGLPNVTLLPNQPKARMPALLSAADCCVIPLRDLPLFRGALPSKMFEAMATARPIVLAVAGEAAELLVESGAGVCVPPERPDEMARAIAALADDPARARALGETGRAWVQQHFSRERIAERFERLLEEARARPRRA